MKEYTQGIELQFMSNIDDIQHQLDSLKTNFQTNFTANGKTTVETSKVEDGNILEFTKTINTFIQRFDNLNTNLQASLAVNGNQTAETPKVEDKNALEFIKMINDFTQQLKGLSTNFQGNSAPGEGPIDENFEGENKNTLAFAEAINNFVRSNSFLSELINFQLPVTWGSMIAKLGKGLMNLFSKAWDQMQEMFSYNYLSSQSVRELRLTWGLDAGEAYAYDTVADMMGISSLEDFSFMSEEELAVFQKSANKLYEIWSEYGSDTTLSDAIMEFKVNMEVLKIEMLKPLMEILNDEQSKEAIITFMKNLPDFLTKLTDVVTGLVEWLTRENVYDQEAGEEYIEKFEGTPFEYTSFELKFLDWLIKKTGGEESNLYDTFNGKKVVEEAASTGAANTTNVNNNIYIDGKEIASESKTYSSSKINNNYSAQTNYYYGG